eukprot:3066402-Prymnesium_polylepis.2
MAARKRASMKGVLSKAPCKSPISRVLRAAQRKLWSHSRAFEDRIRRWGGGIVCAADCAGISMVIAARWWLPQHLKSACPMLNFSRQSLAVFEVACIAEHVHAEASAREKNNHAIHELHEGRARVLIHDQRGDHDVTLITLETCGETHR